MKHRYSILLALFVFAFVAGRSSAQQIPNGSFESWSSEGNPEGWITTNFPGVATPITKSTTAAHGSASLRGEVLSVFGQAVPALAGTGSMISQSEFILGFPFTSRPAALNGFVSAQLSGLDTVNIIAVFRSGGDSIGVGFFRTGNDIASLSSFSAPIQWLDSRSPDTAYVLIVVDGEPQPTVGSVFMFDGLSFGPAASVDRTTEEAELVVRDILGGFTLDVRLAAVGAAKLEIVDLHGRTVATLLDGPTQRQSLRWYGEGLSNGIYMVRFTSPNGILHRKLLLVK